MHVIHRFLLDKYQTSRPVSEARLLDYGCGNGEMVEEGRHRGLNVYGVEAFYEGSNSREIVAGKGLLGEEIRELLQGRIPFPDRYFDFVVSNQVFEHVTDMVAVLKEIERVLVPGGIFVSLFPSQDVIREGHCGVPFIHWFPRTSRWRYSYMLLCRSVGFGYFTGSQSRSQWVIHFLEWLDKYTVYRPYNEIWQSFSCHFPRVYRIEEDYLAYRLGEGKLRSVANVVRLPLVRSLGAWLYRKLGGLVIVCEKARHESRPAVEVNRPPEAMFLRLPPERSLDGVALPL